MPKSRYIEVSITEDEVRAAVIEWLKLEMADEILEAWVVRRATWRTGHQLDITIGPENEA